MKSDSEHALASVIEAALASREFSALRNMLLSVVAAVESEGCALWQAQPKPTVHPESTVEEDKIFVLADGVPDGMICAYHDVPMHSSATGAAMLGQVVDIPDITRD